MDNKQVPDEIRKVAMDFDSAIESKKSDVALFCFAEDCEIELLGIKLIGKDGARKWIDWLYKNLAEVEFLPVTIMVDGNTFFEEFNMEGRLNNGIEVQSKQAEVLVYENYKIKSLRLYFDRLDFADSVARDFISKSIVRKLIKSSLKGLV